MSETPAFDYKPMNANTPTASGNTHWMRNCSIGCGGILLLAAIIGFAIGSNSSPHTYDMNNATEAKAQCEDRISAQLKSPTTATFDDTATGSGTWTVTGTVDSENSFGAMLRATFQCTVVMGDSSATTTIDYLR